MLRPFLVAVSALLLALAGNGVTAQGQHRFQRPFKASRGDTVTPAYEGWYPNPDGTISVSFGYYNRNSEEELYIPLGPDNRLQPDTVVQAQPEYFQPGRHYGVFSVVIPEGYRGEVWWSLNIRGEEVAIPSNLGADFKIDALGPTIMGKSPPRVKFRADGEPLMGPGGAVSGWLQGKPGEPLALTVWVGDNGAGGRQGGKIVVPSANDQVISVDFIKFRGPGDIQFADSRLQWLAADSGKPGSTTATFAQPGKYRIRVRAGDAESHNGSQQCCWTNGYIDVEITE